jgi:hypothetical protein
MADRKGIWANHQELYPVPFGFEDTTYYNDATPSYTGMDGRCMVWMFDEDTQRDVWGDLNHRPFFIVDYHSQDAVYGLADDEMWSIQIEKDNGIDGDYIAGTWGNVLQLLDIIQLLNIRR